MNTFSKIALATLLAVSINATASAGMNDGNPAPSDGKGTIGGKSFGSKSKIGGEFGKRLRENGGGKSTSKSRIRNINGRGSQPRQQSQGNGKK